MNIKNAAAHTGRILLALYFFLPGVMKFMDWDRHVQLMETHGMALVPGTDAANGAFADSFFTQLPLAA